MLKFSEVTDPVYADPEHKRIKCKVKFDNFPEPLVFVADVDDCEEHGRQIHQECLEGKHGPIADYVEPEPVVVILTKKDYETATQRIIDKQAKELGYDNMLSALSYTSYPNQYQEETIKLGQWRSNVWEACYSIIDNAVEEQTPVESFIVLLPTFK